MSVPVPVPSPSPRPPDNPPDRHDTAEVPVTKGEMRRAFRLNEIYTALVATAVAVGAVFGVYRLMLSEAEAAGARSAESVEKRVTTLEQQARQQRDDTHEVQLDVRALYRAVMTGRPQERLEAPPVQDGGP